MSLAGQLLGLAIVISLAGISFALHRIASAIERR